MLSEVSYFFRAQQGELRYRTHFPSDGKLSRGTYGVVYVVVVEEPLFLMHGKYGQISRCGGVRRVTWRRSV